MRRGKRITIYSLCSETLLELDMIVDGICIMILIAVFIFVTRIFVNIVIFFFSFYHHYYNYHHYIYIIIILQKFCHIIIGLVINITIISITNILYISLKSCNVVYSLNIYPCYFPLNSLILKTNRILCCIFRFHGDKAQLISPFLP